ncbi:BppU family phage baseplate upper protein [Lactiplantibacillus pentosus]|uniref:BppU family phage baseplate upper protein n=1 Tax=Lactiplantibacillus pentosus TaxID=1589 RepID=UPI0021A5EF3F|nr:BppU family phage baseplate upper protein [Lactiplantibacillus pentosus]MCT3309257.1 DUF2479 domain-containing protein [Lactiplantibacillus pentosus]
MQSLTYIIGKDQRNLVDDIQNFKIDFKDSNSNWVQARQYEDGMRQVFVTMKNEDGSPFDLTGCNYWFEGILPDGVHKILDAKHGVAIDPVNGKFRFDMPKQAFAVAGSYVQAFFRIMKDGANITTLEFDLQVLADKVISGLVPRDYVTPFEDLYDQLAGILTKADDDVAAAIAELKGKIDDTLDTLNKLNDSNTAKLQTLASSVNAIQAQIDAGNVVTRVQFENVINQKADTTSVETIRKQVENLTGTVLGAEDQNTEIKDARIGHDGHAYSSFGDAIRKQTKNNQDNNYYLQDNIINGGMLKTAPIIFVQGSYSNDADGNLSENNSDDAISKRIRSSVPFQLSRRTTFYLDTAYSFFFSKYEYVNGKYHFVQTFGDTNHLTIDDNGANFYTLIIKQNDDNPIAVIDAYRILQIKSSSLLQEHDEKIKNLQSQANEMTNDDILLNGFQGTTISPETHSIELTDFELMENVKNLTINSNGNLEFEVANSNTWGAIVTAKAKLSLSCAIKGPGWVVVGMDDKSYTMIPLLNATKGKLYSLAKGTTESTSQSEFDVTDIWNKASESQSVFYFEKDGLNLRIYIQDSSNKTLIINYNNCSAFGFVNGSTLQTNLINAQITEYTNVTAAGIKQRVRALEFHNNAGGDANTQLQRFKNYSVLCIGDSITEKNSRASLNWVDYLSTWCGFKNIENNGEGGTGILRPSKPDGKYKNWYSRLNDYTGTYDLILLMGNMNDYSDPAYLGADKLGKFGDDDLTTQYGALNTYLTALMAKYPLARIGWITSTPRQYVDDGSHSVVSKDGFLYGLNSVFQKANQAIIDTCQNYSIPVLDLFHESGLAPWIETNRKAYFSSTDTPDGDGVHPNAIGQKIIANKIYDFVVRNF